MIEINGAPLYGKDSTPNNFALFCSVIGTFTVFIIFIICLIVIKPAAKKPKFKEVQIVLDTSSPVKETVKKEKVLPPKKEITDKKEESVTPPVVKEEKVTPKENSKTVTEKKQPPKKTVTTPKPTPKTQAKPKVEEKVWEEPKYVASTEDAFNAQLNKKEKPTVDSVDWDAMFGDDSSSTTSTSTEKKVTSESSMAGSAGSVSKNSPQKTVGTSSTNSDSDSYNYSGETSNLLKEIENTTFTSSSTGATTQTSIQSGTTSDNSVVIQMDNGRRRLLVSPKEPSIDLSEDAIKQISGNPKVSITITVLTSGNVSKIDFNPRSLLPPIAINEITNQISKWIFEPADYNGTAHFDYEIVKK